MKFLCIIVHSSNDVFMLKSRFISSKTEETRTQSCNLNSTKRQKVKERTTVKCSQSLSADF